MNGIHDMGGMHGFGPVVAEPDEPVFHDRWEGRCMALNRAMGFCRLWSIDASRFGIEKLPADVYLRSSYYERWALRLQNMLVEHGLVAPDEIAAGRSLRQGVALPRKLTLADVEATFTRGAFAREARAPARFKPGDHVRTINFHPPTHTRLPRYARDRAGVVEHVRGCHVFPDVAASGQGEDPQWLYAVRFEGRELWGPDADPRLIVSIEAFEPYLQAA